MILPIFSHLSSLCSVADNFFYSNVWYPYMRPSFKCLSLYINISNIYVHVTYMCKRNIFFDPGCNNKKRLGVLDKIYPSFSCLFLSLSLYLYLSLSLFSHYLFPTHSHTHTTFSFTIEKSNSYIISYKHFFEHTFAVSFYHIATKLSFSG